MNHSYLCHVPILAYCLLIFGALQRSPPVLGGVGSTCPVWDVTGSLSRRRPGLKHSVHAEELQEGTWRLQTVWSYRPSSASRFQCECGVWGPVSWLDHSLFDAYSKSEEFCCGVCVWFSKTTVWIWLKRFGSEEQVLNGGCTQMALGGVGQWRTEKCSGQHVYLCETDMTGKTFTPQVLTLTSLDFVL